MDLTTAGFFVALASAVFSGFALFASWSSAAASTRSADASESSSLTAREAIELSRKDLKLEYSFRIVDYVAEKFGRVELAQAVIYLKGYRKPLQDLNFSPEDILIHILHPLSVRCRFKSNPAISDALEILK